MGKKIIGVDEAGRGPVIGPLVVCGVLVREEDVQKLLALGVKDSKQVPKKRREFLFDIIKTVVEKYEIVQFTPSEIDTYMKRGVSLNDIEAQAMVSLIAALDGDCAYIDCPSTNKEKFAAVLHAQLQHKIELVAEHKADENYVWVGAASILAKVIRDREIEKLQQTYGDFGSGYPSDPKTKEFLQKNAEKHPELFRHYWEPWERAITEKKQKKLGDF